jgi:TonB-linked SusC/RagA family outer membrane protein
MKSMIKIAKSILPLLGLLLSLSLSAQDIAVKGHVKDHTGEPLIGANILIKGTSVGTISDVDGNFTLKAAVNDILSITCIGFKGQELTVTGSNTPLVITLQEDTEMLDEVVVIGYGQVKKGDVTGSLLTVKPDELNKGKQLTAEDALVGKVAGVNIVPGSGAPGSGGTIRIRMGASLSADNDPLIVIDGVPVSNASISSINPNDIASFTVLKDASATAIYGSRASNGVIIITTKKGNTDGVSRPSFSYSANVTVGNVYKKLDVLSASEYREAFAKYANAPEAFKLGDVNTDWQDEIYRVAMGTDHNLSMTGALKNMPYRVSVGYTNQNGTLKNNNYQRLNASIGLSPKFFDKHLSVDINIKGSIEDEKPVSTSVIGSAVGFDPTRPVYQNYDGNVGLGYYMWMGVSNTPITLAASNPVSDLELADKQNKTKRSIGNIALDYKIHGFEDFRLNLNMGYDFLTEDKHDNMPDLAPAMYTGNE